MKKALLIHPAELSREWVETIKTAGCNVLALHPVGGDRAHLFLEQMLEDMEKQEFKDVINYAVDLGIEIEYEMHAAHYFLPDSLFLEHPEYFRLNDEGKRAADFNFCVSNEDALGYVAEKALELAKRLYRSNHNFYFWLDDVRESGCRCERCRGFSPSEQQLIVMNKIIGRLREEIPDARLAYLAYHDCAKPPVKVKPNEGIFLEYAPIERWYKGSTVRMEDLNENILDLLACFGKKGARVLEYWFDNSLFSSYQKPPAKFTPDNEAIKSDIAIYREYGFEEIASFACYFGADYEELYGKPDISAFCE